MIECSLKRPQPERALGQQIPVKRLYMPNVENDAVSFRNRPVVHRFFANHLEYFVGARSCVKQSAMKVMPDADSGGDSSHGVFPLPLDAASSRRMRQNSAQGG
jgi:hypothetical protein